AARLHPHSHGRTRARGHLTLRGGSNPMTPSDQAATPRTGLMLSDDLLFTSRVAGTARERGLSVVPARSAEALLQLARRETPACVLVDLENAGLSISEFVRQLGECCTPPPYVVAYGSHVNTASLRAARAAGCDVVVPRSQFVELLPSSLTG